LNQFHPAIVFGYGSVVAFLAGEQAAGRLHIKPVLLIPSGETLRTGEYHRIGQFQIVQTRPSSLRVRLRLVEGADPDHVWQAVHGEISQTRSETLIVG
jgi:hypothetical protein